MLEYFKGNWTGKWVLLSELFIKLTTYFDTIWVPFKIGLALWPYSCFVSMRSCNKSKLQAEKCKLISLEIYSVRELFIFVRVDELVCLKLVSEVRFSVGIVASTKIRAIGKLFWKREYILRNTILRKTTAALNSQQKWLIIFLRDILKTTFRHYDDKGDVYPGRKLRWKASLQKYIITSVTNLIALSYVPDMTWVNISSFIQMRSDFYWSAYVHS